MILYFDRIHRYFGFPLLAAGMFVWAWLSGTGSAGATPLKGAELTYTYTGVNQYRVTLTLYRDCNSTLGLPTDYLVNYSSPACGVSATATLGISVQADISEICPSQTSACSSGNSPEGLEAHEYTGIINLPPGCSDWIVSASNCCRSDSLDNLASPGSNMFYVSTRIDNTLSAGNSSPVFSYPPSLYVCANQDVELSAQATDPDGDLLVYSLVNCRQSSAATVTYNSGYSGVNPLSEAVSINSTTGQLTFTPTTIQEGSICVRVEEYRSAVKIGEVTRDIHISVENCTNEAPLFSGINNIANAYSVSVCEGSPLCFTVSATDPNISDAVTMSPLGSISGSTFNITGTGNSRTGTFCWTPPVGSAGSYFLNIQARDNTCPYPARSIRTYTINVLANANAPINAGPDVTICSGNSAVLNASSLATNITAYSWSPAIGLSATSTASVTASPVATTDYTVTATHSDGCLSRDNVRVTVSADPLANITTPTLYACPSSNVTLTGTTNVTGMNYQWFNPVFIPLGSGAFIGTTTTINVTVPGTNGTYRYTLRATNPVSGCVSDDFVDITVGTADPLASCQIIYASPTGSGSGTQASPASLTNALSMAACQNATIKLAIGTYTINNPINLSSFITLEGGFDPAFSWRKTSQAGATTITRSALNPEGVANAQRLVAIYANSATGFRLQDLTVTTEAATPGTGMSTYGIHLTSCSNYNIVRCQVLPGAAGSGAAGTNGTAGLAGTAGSFGFAGDIDDQDNPGHGGNGGNGGGAGNGIGGNGGFDNPTVCCFAGVAGSAGTASTNIRAGGAGGGGGCGGEEQFNGGAGGNGGGVNGGAAQLAGGFGGAWGNPGTTGGNGTAGSAGTNGATGAAGAAGSHVGGFWVPGAQAGTGTDGAGGRGGCGGGGGGGQYCTFCLDGAGNGGGGGGGGGQGGTGGTGGRGGGSSYGIYLLTNGAGGIIDQSRIISGTAGAGGTGGAGGPGGAGGVGGTGALTGTAEIGRGGNGGAGGNGGGGGQGGTGAIGQSINVHLQSGTAPATNNNSFNLPGQTTIFVNNVHCTNTNVTYETAASSGWDFDVSTNAATPPTGSGTSVTTQYVQTGRYSVSCQGTQFTGFHRIHSSSTTIPVILTNATQINTDTFIICQGQFAVFESQYPALTYQWNFNGAAINPGSVRVTASTQFNTPGLFPVTLNLTTDCCGLSPTKTIYLNVVRNPTPTGSGAVSICAGQSTTLTLNGLTAWDSVVWSPNLNIQSSTANTITVRPSATTTYIASVYTKYTLGSVTRVGCPTVISFPVTVNPRPTISFTPVQPTCNNNGQLTATGNPVGLYNFSWSAGPTTFGSASSTIGGLLTGRQIVTATSNASGCAVTDTFYLYPAPSAPSIYLQASTPASCNISNGSATVATSGGVAPYSYSWNTGGGNITTKSNLPFGNHCVVVTDGIGCASNICFLLGLTDPISINTLSTSAPLCTSSNNGDIKVLAQGGQGLLTYSWSNGQTGKNATGLTAGSYTVTVTDAVGCSNNAVINLAPVNTSSTAPTIAPVGGTVCPNTNITLTASGGTNGSGATIRWYSGPNGTGTFLGSGSNITVAPLSTTTYYARREGICNTTADASTTVTVKTFTYAADGATTNTYCTDNAGWHHFYLGNEIIFSVNGDLSGMGGGFPSVTINDNGVYYQNNGGPGTAADCAINFSPGEERFEMERNWNLNTGGFPTIGTYDVRFYYPPAERTTVENAATNWMASYPACSYTYKYAFPIGFYWFKNSSGTYTAPQYDGLRFSGTAGTTSNGINYAQINGITSFSGGSGAIILSPDPVLPIELLSFTGTTDGTIHYLNWETAQEVNASHFEIQRSDDAVRFQTISELSAAGNTTAPQAYRFEDRQPIPGNSYYRLRLVDLDGSFRYSSVITLRTGQEKDVYHFSPNPAGNTVYYYFQGSTEEVILIEIFDILGHKTGEQKTVSGIGMNNTPADLNNLPAGTYTIRSTHLQSGIVRQARIIRNSP